MSEHAPPPGGVAFANDEQARYWSEHASNWAAAEDLFELVGAEPGFLAMNRLGLRPGQRVLDIGCGTGCTTVDLARAVAPDGEALGVDIADELLDHARRRAAAAAPGGAVRFLHADAQVHAFEPGRFDAAFSRFGVMFFADPVTAFANIRGALRVGGVLSFASWQTVFANEWILVPAIAALSVMGTGPQLPTPDEPGPFSLADPARVRSLLAGAGFTEIDVVAHDDAVVIAEHRIAEVAAQSTRLGAVRRLLGDAGDETRAQVVEAIEVALRDRVRDGVVELSRGVLLVSARA